MGIYPIGLILPGLLLHAAGIRVKFVEGWIMYSCRLTSNFSTLEIQKRIRQAEERGVMAATHEGVEFIKDDIIQEEQYVGHKYYPDVKASTKRQKVRKGRDTVLIDTTNTLSSFNGEVKGLEGKITGGGKAYHSRLFSRWQIGKLFMEVHSKESQKIITKAIEKVL